MKMKKIRFISIITLFALIIGTFSVALIVKKPIDISDWERRKLQQFPTLSYETLMSGKFMKEFETYLTDQFPLRNTWRTLKAKIHFDVFQAKDNNGIFIHDGHASKFDGKVNERSIKHFTDSMTELYDTYLKGTDSKIYYAVVPDKNRFLTVDTDYPVLDYSALYKAVEEGMTFAQKIEIEDLLSIDDYYTTDTHWKQERITDVADRILTSMGMEDTGDFTEEVMGDFYGVYYGQSALPLSADKITLMTNTATENSTVYNVERDETVKVYEKSHYENMDSYDVYLGGASSILEINNPEGEKGRELVVFRDSFGSSITPLLLEGYSKVTLIDTRYIVPQLVGEYVDFTGQDVLFLYSSLIINSSIGVIK